MFRKRRGKATGAGGGLFRRRTNTRRLGGHGSGRLAFEPLETRLVLDSTVVFNEIMYNPPGDNDAQLEWIELYNQLAVNMDVSEWSIRGGVEYEFPDGTVVPGRGHLVVAISPDDLEAATGYAGALGPFENRLSNGGEQLRLINNDGRVMNVVEYGDEGEWPVGPDGGGVTLAKRDPESASEDPANWTFSAQINGTPGSDNFPSSEEQVFETLLPSGAAVRALVPEDDTPGLDWIETDFDDSAWLWGTTGVGYERSTGYDSYLGLDLDAPPGGQTPMPMRDVNATVYTRIPFELDTDLAQFDSLYLKMRYDDGFVAYLNGEEIDHANAPGRDGNTDPLLWNSGATSGHSDSAAVVFETTDITFYRDAFVPHGSNVLAVHGLNHGTGSSDLLMLPELVGARTVGGPLEPTEMAGLVINEVAPAGDPEFWLEIANLGQDEVELEGARLTVTGASGGDYVFPAQTLSPGQFLEVVLPPELRVESGEKVFLYPPDEQQLVDACVVKSRPRGRSSQHDGRWLYPDAPSPGEANVFDLQEEIVINEIMYHPFPELATPGTPATYDTVTLLEIDAQTTWRYNQTGADLGADWAQTTHPVDNVSWFEGPGLIGYETNPGALPEPLRTWLDNPRDVTLPDDPYVVTYYFETEFEFNGNLDEAGLQLAHVIDDGAIFYLNGAKVLPYRMDDGLVNAATLAQSTVGDATYVGPTTIPKDSLRVGTNVLSVEVHQGSTNSSDVMFGVELFARTQLTEPVPGEPFEEPSEEWIELYNRGTTPVDLEGWELCDAIEFEFPPGTTLQPAEYLVVAQDAAALREKYPAIDVVGDFSRSLSDRDERILLEDAEGNPADEVHYYERGRWPEYADGGGSSLELRNPFADNSKAETWAASDETAKSTWNTYTIRGVCEEHLEIPKDLYNEFIFGLLDSGEFLIDDVSVKHDPDGAASEMIQNGTFEDDPLNQPPDKWRLIGTHSGQVVLDPDDPDNQVLHVVACGPQQHVHDHVETTFVGNTAVRDGDEYEISFRARWLAGNSQLNNRFYFTRLGNTVQLEVPERNGTPGVENSTFEANLGPTYRDLEHRPVLPADNQPVTVSVTAEDPHGVASMTLWWAVNGVVWNSLPMTGGADGVYTATIPGQPSSTVVQFFVYGQDGQGAISMFPAAGPQSRALYQVQDGRGTTTPIDTIRLVLVSADSSTLYADVNESSNNYVGCTVIRNADEAYYDVGVRQVGSRFVRPNSGYKVRLNPEQKLYGVHSSFRIDRSGGGPREIYMKQMVNRAGGSSVSLYDDIAYVVAPKRGGIFAGTILLQLARYEDIFLNEQFEDGGDGTRFELDDITYPTLAGGVTDPEAYKTETGVSSPDINDRGGDKEAYRAHLLIKNNRAKDDYSKIVEMAQAIHLTGQELYEATRQVMDVDLWMRHYATQAMLGNWDTYGFSRPKNLRIYVRPEDQKVIPMYWDADIANLNRGSLSNLISYSGSSRLDEIRDLPQNLRLFYGHMWDLVNRSFNAEYMAPWIAHYNSLGAGINGDVVGLLADLVDGDDVNQCVRKHILTNIPPLDFQITTRGGEPYSVDDVAAILEGDGWVDVREIYLAGSDEPLEVTWTDETSWRVTVPLGPGPNELTLTALDYEGNPTGTDSITVTSTVSDRPVEDYLRISEIHYHPHPATAEEAAGYELVRPGEDVDEDLFEFIELQNTSEVVELDLTGVELGDGIEFDFSNSAVTTLAPGEHVVVVRDEVAFALRYPDEGIKVAGHFEKGLGNGGDTIRLSVGPVTILDFHYGDSNEQGWPDRADGRGASLEILDPEGDYADPDNWRSGSEYGGSPGFAGIGPSLGVVINEVLARTGTAELDAIELHNVTQGRIDVGGWYLSDLWGWPGADVNDGEGNYRKFCIPEDVKIEAGKYVVFDERDFNPNGEWNPEAGQRGENEFALDGAHGEQLWLMRADPEGNLTHFVDHVNFDPTQVGQTLGRWPQSTDDLYPMCQPTLGEPNTGPYVGRLVVSEVMYQPADPDGPGGVDPNDLEFVEVYNRTSQPVSLESWQIDGGIDFDFGADTAVGPWAALVVLPFDPQNAANSAKWSGFCSAYGLDPTDKLGFVGGYGGNLDDAEARVGLLSPAPPLDELGSLPRALEDEVDYAGTAPWPTGAAGGGDSLQRIAGDLWGNAPESWTAAQPSPGSVGFQPEVGEVVGRHVFYNNSTFDDSSRERSDQNAIAPDPEAASDPWLGKTALLPGGTATFQNYTSYEKGLNGVIIDVAGLWRPADLSAEQDFEFKVGNSSDPGSWPEPPDLPAISVQEHAGAGGSDRVTLIWDDHAVVGQWLQVKVLATENTGLLQDDVFYFGNAPGEAGDSAGNAIVNTWDELVVRNNLHGPRNPAEIDDAYDYNRDGLVNSTDRIIARANRTGIHNALQLITVPGAEGGVSAPSLAAAHDVVLKRAVQREPERQTTPSGKLAWLWDLDQAFAQRRSSRKTRTADPTVDALLAARQQ